MIHPQYYSNTQLHFMDMRISEQMEQKANNNPHSNSAISLEIHVWKPTYEEYVCHYRILANVVIEITRKADNNFSHRKRRKNNHIHETVVGKTKLFENRNTSTIELGIGAGTRIVGLTSSIRSRNGSERYGGPSYRFNASTGGGNSGKQSIHRTRIDKTHA